MTTVHDPDLGVGEGEDQQVGGTTPFMAPELLVPSRFGLENCVPTKGADVYAMAMTIYQVRMVWCPVGTRADSHIILGPRRIIAVR